MPSCPLCSSDAYQPIFKAYRGCRRCRGIFLPGEDHLTPDKERLRYLEHQNDVFDPRYRQFTSPISDAILRDYTPLHAGLDFGAGPGPVISQVLSEHGYKIAQYDPFFHDLPDLLQHTYDYIACCEVIEHFRDPAQEFRLLRGLLNAGGRLYCMTHLYTDTTAFANWYYKNDPSHVFFYTKDTLHWIAANFGFAHVVVEDRLSVFSVSE